MLAALLCSSGGTQEGRRGGQCENLHCPAGNGVTGAVYPLKKNTKTQLTISTSPCTWFLEELQGMVHPGITLCISYQRNCTICWVWADLKKLFRPEVTCRALPAFSVLCLKCLFMISFFFSANIIWDNLNNETRCWYRILWGQNILYIVAEKEKSSY